MDRKRKPCPLCPTENLLEAARRAYGATPVGIWIAKRSIELDFEARDYVLRSPFGLEGELELDQLRCSQEQQLQAEFDQVCVDLQALEGRLIFGLSYRRIAERYFGTEVAKRKLKSRQAKHLLAVRRLSSSRERLDLKDLKATDFWDLCDKPGHKWEFQEKYLGIQRKPERYRTTNPAGLGELLGGDKPPRSTQERVGQPDLDESVLEFVDPLTPNQIRDKAMDFERLASKLRRLADEKEKGQATSKPPGP